MVAALKTPDQAGTSTQPKPMARWLRRLLLAVSAVLAAFMVGCWTRSPVCLPFDFFWNLGPVFEAPELRTRDDDKVRVVFLQHGMWRTSMALDRIERTLRHHGYEVINTDYPSTSDYLEAHAKRLRDTVETRFARGRVDEVSFVGHSMGGLVIHEYLRRTDSRKPKACIYIATPQRGAILAGKRRNWFLYELLMGTKAARQLATTDPIHQLAIPYGDRSGAIIGDIGEGNDDIPGPDDGTVGVTEARFDGIADTVFVPYGHTSIVVMDQVLHQILHFLCRGGFAATGKDG